MNTVETPFLLRKKIVYATTTLFPIIILVESVIHIVSLSTPYGLDAVTAFPAPFRME